MKRKPSELIFDSQYEYSETKRPLQLSQANITHARHSDSLQNVAAVSSQSLDLNSLSILRSRLRIRQSDSLPTFPSPA